MVSPVVAVVAEISAMMVRKVVKGRPRQFPVMKLNIRCSMRFDLGGPRPGSGRW
jgi:hypothetical protein